MSNDHYQDQVSYSGHDVELVLPSVWDPDFILSSRLPRDPSTGVKARVDPRHVSGWVLACADVQRAWYRSGLDEAERECLRHVHYLGFTLGRLASAWGEAPEDIHAACQSGLGKIADYLNGKVPA